MIAGLLMSINDPGWGRSGGGGKGGPPDLDELWRDFNRRLNGLLGRGHRADGPGSEGGGGNRGPASRFPHLTPRQFGGGIGVVLGLVGLIWLATGFYVVDASQRGVVLQFGRYKETTEPGLRWRFPWPVQSHEVVNLSGVRTLEIGYRGSEKNRVQQESIMLTDDENIVAVQFAVQYLLKDPVHYVFKNRNPDDAVSQAAETAIREIVGKSKMDFVLYEGRDDIAARTQKLVQDILDRYETGIQIRSVTLQSTQPPEQVQAAFDDAVKAGQDRERQKNEGQAYANDVIPRAGGAAARLSQEAEGYRQRLIATAEGDAARFRLLQAEYAKAPEVTRERLYLETLQQVYANTSKVMIDAKGGSNLLYLPLDKLMQQSRDNGAGDTFADDPSASVVSTVPPPRAVAPEQNNTAAASSTTNARSRDSGLTRDRGDR
jgi:membrane protease subunit HflK